MSGLGRSLADTPGPHRLSALKSHLSHAARETPGVMRGGFACLTPALKEAGIDLSGGTPYTIDGAFVAPVKPLDGGFGIDFALDQTSNHRLRVDKYEATTHGDCDGNVDGATPPSSR